MNAGDVLTKLGTLREEAETLLKEARELTSTVRKREERTRTEVMIRELYNG